MNIDIDDALLKIKYTCVQCVEYGFNPSPSPLPHAHVTTTCTCAAACHSTSCSVLFCLKTSCKVGEMKLMSKTLFIESNSDNNL